MFATQVRVTTNTWRLQIFYCRNKCKNDKRHSRCTPTLSFKGIILVRLIDDAEIPIYTYRKLELKVQWTGANKSCFMDEKFKIADLNKLYQ